MSANKLITEPLWYVFFYLEMFLVLEFFILASLHKNEPIETCGIPWYDFYFQTQITLLYDLFLQEVLNCMQKIAKPHSSKLIWTFNWHLRKWTCRNGMSLLFISASLFSLQVDCQRHNEVKGAQAYEHVRQSLLRELSAQNSRRIF